MPLNSCSRAAVYCRCIRYLHYSLLQYSNFLQSLHITHNV
jgi:hypothetical protein